VTDRYEVRKESKNNNIPL